MRAESSFEMMILGIEGVILASFVVFLAYNWFKKSAENGRSRYDMNPVGYITHHDYKGHLKTWPEYFRYQWDGRKTFELRLDRDRGFGVGQQWLLLEFEPDYTQIGVGDGLNPVGGTYSGRGLLILITFVMDEAVFGLKPGWKAIGYKVVTRFHRPLREIDATGNPVKTHIEEWYKF